MKTRETVITETTAAIHAATGADARHEPDVRAAVAAAYDAGATGAAPIVHVAALTAEEIALVRDVLRGVAKQPVKK